MSDEPTNTQAGPAGDSMAAASALPARTTPTWEMELLLSGATVFGLLQLPDKLDRFFIAWINNCGEVLASFVLPLAVYTQFVVFVLAITFVVHLCLRGYWVALVGVHSVYPGGMRRDTDRYGPHYLEVMRRRERSAPDLIEAADNRATLVFAVGVGLALAIALPMFAALLAIAVILMAGWLHLDLVLVRAIFLAALLALLLPMMIAAGWDRQRGTAIAADSRTGRLLRRVFDLYARLGMLRGGNSLLNVFTSQFGGRRGSWVLMLVITGAMMAFGMRMVVSGQEWNTGATAALPADRPDSRANLHARFYDSLRDDAPTLGPMPFINGPVVEGPYLRLFVPYRPRRHDAVVSARCPQAAPGAEALACFAGLIAVRLDDRPLAFVPVAARDPQSGQRGMLAMIPAAALAAGRHELEVRMPRRPGETRNPVPYRIPFWR